MTIGSVLRTERGNRSQQQMVLELELPISRESLSQYENNRTEMPADISRMISEKARDPWFHFNIAREYTGFGPKKPDGRKAILHPSAWKEIAVREMQEAIESLNSFNFAQPLESIENWQYEDLQRVADQAIDAQYAAGKLIAVLAESSKLDVVKAYKDNERKLIARGYYKEG
ncbi:hypothetical protein [Jeotgalibacillus haloalkalitolerans]|uniref:HTH cro/C1-type domain-containing protein n=1 Tax=Jeotgalibacillus haloalkalitolerans TaxID=3104292 RepID=A0ABU5KK35_9BACL|nr:hypothetical protein [Jeotgalibacillus sp. HH7-29]MDZ5711619.1 hypothetical protein [Jeotgalibacillus sp. HH7-29]